MIANLGASIALVAPVQQMFNLSLYPFPPAVTHYLFFVVLLYESFQLLKLWLWLAEVKDIDNHKTWSKIKLFWSMFLCSLTMINSVAWGKDVSREILAGVIMQQFTLQHCLVEVNHALQCSLWEKWGSVSTVPKAKRAKGDYITVPLICLFTFSWLYWSM